jgi:hypothetical protein
VPRDHGKRAPAPCGHEGETVVGGYVACERCDPEWDEVTQRIQCPHLEYHEMEHTELGIFGPYTDYIPFCVACGERLYVTIGKVKVKL